jgi:hypothetical protein
MAFGVDEGVALNAFNFLARVIADRVNGGPPCMGRSLSRGCNRGPLHFLIPQFLCSTWQPFLRPDPRFSLPARAGAVKAGPRLLRGPP